MSDAPIRGEPHNPGAGGWPTIRYFNKETGPDGANYDKKTSKSMCDELGDFDTMIEYVEAAGSTSLCSVIDGSGCDERSLKYLEKMKLKSLDEQQAQITRLEGMEGNQMKEELKEWILMRKKLLKNLVAAAADGNNEEL